MSAPAPAVGARQAAYDVLARTFDRVFVITLPRATDRQARVRDRLDGLPFEFSPGVDKRELDLERLERDGVYSGALARRMSRTGKVLTTGHIGASLAHRNIYEAAVREGWERTLVFEDDVYPVDAALTGLPAALEELPPGWDFLYLGYFNLARVTARDRMKQVAYLGLSALGLMKWSFSEVRRLLPRPFSPHLRRAGLHHGAHAYAFSLAGAKKLLAAQTPVSMNCDQLFVKLVLRGELDAYVAEPSLFDQDSIQGGGHSFINE